MTILFGLDIVSFVDILVHATACRPLGLHIKVVMWRNIVSGIKFGLVMLTKC